MARIGVLDSGIGGMVMLEALKKRYPKQDFIFLADQKNSPYGSKTGKELTDIVNRNLLWLKKKGADSILMACNTISALDPKLIDQSLPIQRVIEPTCRQLLHSNAKCVIVCATPFTCASKSYEHILHQLCPQLHVISVPLDYLCRDLEDMVDKDVILTKFQRDLSRYSTQADALILGCTHYPLAKELFQSVMDVPVYDSNGIVLENCTESKGEVVYYTTDNPEYFDEQCERLFQIKIHSLKAEI